MNLPYLGRFSLSPLLEPRQAPEMSRRALNDERRIRFLLYAYYVLLLSEGILRKWIVPQLSAPLAIVRDPVVILIYIMAIRAELFPTDPWVVGAGLLGAITFVVGQIPEQNSIFVDLFGLRTNFLHIPLIFIMGRMLRREDVLRIGKWSLLVVIPAAILMVIQFRSPATAWINTTSGGDGVQINGAAGSIRPPSIFTFTTGVAEFFSLTTAFLIYGTIKRGVYSKVLLIAAGASIVVGLSVSISRLGLTMVGLVVAMLGCFSLMRPGFVTRFIPITCVALLSLFFFANFPFFQKGLHAFNERIDTASAHEGGMSGYARRIGRTFFGGLNIVGEVPLVGEGLGMGTNAGSKLLTGQNKFLLAEDEWSRNLLESGPVLGLLYIAGRVGLSLFLAVQGLRLAYRGDPLALLIFGACFALILIGQLGRPTSMGFAFYGAGLCYAAIQSGKAMFARPSRGMKTRITQPPLASLVES